MSEGADLPTRSGCCLAARCLALEALWRALSDFENTRIGYNPAVAEACEALRGMDREGLDDNLSPIDTDKAPIYGDKRPSIPQ